MGVREPSGDHSTFDLIWVCSIFIRVSYWYCSSYAYLWVQSAYIW